MLFLIAFANQAKGQLQHQTNNLRAKKIAVTSKPQIIDSLVIIPETLQFSSGISKNDYTINYEKSTITFSDQKNLPDSVSVTYRVFLVPLDFTFQKFRKDSLAQASYTPSEIIIENQASQKNIFDFGSMQSTGSIGRSISFGNSQDAVVNSAMNLQITGMVADSLEITAAISDNNLPIQPEGNTQDLRDFDRIFIQAKKRDWQITLGDIDVRANTNYFLNFYKRQQGIALQFTNQIPRTKITNTLQVSGAMAKGKFARNILQVVEGNQGPYRLVGNNNELFFTILANTERVYIDGIKMQRGEDQDYTINYNNAEISFTPKRMVTKDSRIQIEFEYADRTYLNSVLYLNNTTNFGKKTTLNIAAYQSKDAKNTTIDQSLSDAQKKILGNVGDSVQNAISVSATQESFDAAKVQYKKQDTIVNNNTYRQIFTIVSQQTDTVYNVSFSFVGANKGNYKEITSGNLNGRAYQWVVPVNGVPQGSWEPVVRLISPKNHQIFTVTAQHNLSPKTNLKAEAAISNYDINLFSSKDKKNDKGLGLKLGIQHELTALKVLNDTITPTLQINVEYVQKNYKPLERLRSVEFYRDWGIGFDKIVASNELYGAYQIKLPSVKKQQLNYTFYHFSQQNYFHGIRHFVNTINSYKQFTLSVYGSYTRMHTITDSGYFFRPFIELKKEFKHLSGIVAGMRYTQETQVQKSQNILTPQSFRFDIKEAFLNWKPINKNQYGLSVFERKDWLPAQTQLQAVNKSFNINATAELLTNVHHQVKFSLTYRDLKIFDSLRSKEKADKNLLGRVTYNFSLLQNFIGGNTLYETGGGQEQKREMVFVEVPAGQGNYMWIDYNNNGIAELNEFEEAIYADQRKYIRLFNVTNKLINAKYVQYNYNIQLDPTQLFAAKTNLTGFSKTLSKLYFISALQISKKAVLPFGKFLFNPFDNQISDTSVIALYAFQSNTFFYNRNSSIFSFDITQSSQKQNILLNYGLEKTQQNQQRLQVRKSISRNWLTTLSIQKGQYFLQSKAPKFENKNYAIQQWQAEPGITFNYKSVFRASLSYNYLIKQNKIDSLERSISHSFILNSKYTIASNTSIAAKLTYNMITFDAYAGAANTTVGYVMLDGLRPGKNMLANVELIKRIGKAIEVTIQYDGRKPENTRMIHTARMGVRALF